jgi:phenylpropionate dioxygenase-like ring-hydroxylating dioxygenase large terminal subunit
MAPPQLLPPFPTGWYVLAYGDELPPHHIRSLAFMGQEIVLFRTQSGQVAAMEAYCPHLGAHLGYGGTVEGECIRCPFHGFQFDVQGNCTFIPYGTRQPPKARTQTFPTRERNGLILAYFDGEGQSPGWEVPELNMDGWSPLLEETWKLRGHPQETTENSVDIGHFSQIHRYTAVEVLRPLLTDGPYLNLRYAMTRATSKITPPVRTEFEIHVHGLGYSLVEVTVPQFDVHYRLFVLATPMDGNEIHLRVALSLYQDTSLRKIHPLLALIPRALVNPLIARITFAGFKHDVRQDFVIWQHKRYVQPPILAEGDGPVGKYRLWAKQFYKTSERERV